VRVGALLRVPATFCVRRLYGGEVITLPVALVRGDFLCGVACRAVRVFFCFVIHSRRCDCRATRQEKERKKHKKFDDAEDAEAQPAWTAEQEWNEGEAENAEEEVAEELPLDFLQAAARQQRQVISDALKSADLHKKKKNKKKKEASLVKKVGNFRVKVLEAHDPFALIGREQSAAMDFLANSRSGDKRVPTILGLVGRKATGPAPKFSK
jgi:recombination DNA repair RAD52 pathway protein